jgi:hypothetical protein
MIITDYDRHLCTNCGHMIGLHTDSPFGHNPLDKDGHECNLSRQGLVIDILISWLQDAVSERDAYMKSYDKECNTRDAWQNTATVLSVKLRRAVEVLKYYALTNDGEYNQGPARDALIDIEGE